MTIGAITIAFFIGTKVKARVIIFDSIGIFIIHRVVLIFGFWAVGWFCRLVIRSRSRLIGRFNRLVSWGRRVVRSRGRLVSWGRRVIRSRGRLVSWGRRVVRSRGVRCWSSINYRRSVRCTVDWSVVNRSMMYFRRSMMYRLMMLNLSNNYCC